MPLITRLEEHFTKYEAKQVAHLTSKYATRLYELLIAWREVGKVPLLELSEFRNRLGLIDNEYTAMSDFKSVYLNHLLNKLTNIPILS